MSHTNMGTWVLAAAVLAAALIVAGVPLATLLPFAILLVCPLMMVFMMKGMSHGVTRSRDNTEDADTRR
jgi:choline-glycine betaine transporter